MLEPSQRAPFENDSTGLGQIILHATANGAKRLVIGIGGSATNDGANEEFKGAAIHGFHPFAKQFLCLADKLNDGDSKITKILGLPSMPSASEER